MIEIIFFVSDHAPPFQARSFKGFSGKEWGDCGWKERNLWGRTISKGAVV